MKTKTAGRGARGPAMRLARKTGQGRSIDSPCAHVCVLSFLPARRHSTAAASAICTPARVRPGETASSAPSVRVCVHVGNAPAAAFAGGAAESMPATAVLPAASCQLPAARFWAVPLPPGPRSQHHGHSASPQARHWLGPRLNVFARHRPPLLTRAASASTVLRRPRRCYCYRYRCCCCCCCCCFFTLAARPSSP